MWQLLWPAVAFVATMICALLIRGVLLSTTRRFASPGSGLAALVDAVRVPSLLWCVVLGLYAAVEVALHYANLPPRLASRLGVLLEVAIILSITITLAGVVGTVIGRASERQALGGPVTGLAQTTARLTVLAVGLLIVLSAVGIQITPILTALGVGGLAVALALQDTLSNLFAGIHLLADKPIRVGHYVKVAEGAEGFVIDIGWRSTRLRSLQNNVVVVPNRIVAQSIITNYDLPEPFIALPIRVSVSYATDADRVEALLSEEARRATGEVPGLLAKPEPVVRLVPGFGEYSLDFTLSCNVASSGDQGLVQHELRKRILRRFRAEGIEIAVPARTVRLQHMEGHEGQS